MRQRAGVLSELVTMYLEAKDYQQVVGEWDDFLNRLKNKGDITVSYVEDEEKFSRIAEVAEFLQSRIFMDVVDSWMYACALVMMADKIITFDGYFKRVINRLHSPQGDPDWQQLQNELQQMLENLLEGASTLSIVATLPQKLPDPW
jgi:predicted nucleic acid-binding protein